LRNRKKQVLIPLLLVTLTVGGLLPYGLHWVSAQYTFTNPQILQYVAGTDEYPASLQSANGSLWIAWDHPQRNIYYQTYNYSRWTGVQTLPTSTTFNLSPGLGQFGNGSIIMLWSSNQTGHWNLWYQLFNGNTWTTSTRLTTTTSDDFFPTSVVASNSTLWVFWERITGTGPGSEQVYYKTLKGSTWSPDAPLTGDPGQNTSPSALALGNGGVWVSYSKLDPATGNYEIFHRTFNGLQWSAEFQLTSGNGYDLEPSLVQDRNGTIWLFWSRQIQLSGGANGIYEQKIFSIYTQDLGSTWSQPVQRTFFGDTTNPVDDLEPTVVQGLDKDLWVFYSSDQTGFGSDFDIYYIKSNQISPIVHVNLKSLQVSPAKNYPWGYSPTRIATITVTVANIGDLNENVTVSLQASNTTFYPSPIQVGSKAAIVAAYTSLVFTFNWNVTGIHPGRYTLLASLSAVPGESPGNSMNNSLTVKSGVIILYRGDINHDGIVNIRDIILDEQAYGSTVGTPKFIPDGDVFVDGIINIRDLIILEQNYNLSI